MYESNSQEPGSSGTGAPAGGINERGGSSESIQRRRPGTGGEALSGETHGDRKEGGGCAVGEGKEGSEVTEAQGWFVIVLLAVIAFKPSGFGMGEVVGLLKSILEEALDVKCSVDEMRNSLHCIETDTHRVR